MQTRHVVVWRIDIYAENPIEAAQIAWEAMRAPDSTANYFEVRDQDDNQTNVDLAEEHAKEDEHICALAEFYGH